MIGRIVHPRQDRPFPPKSKSSKQLGLMPAWSELTSMVKQAVGGGTSGFTKGFIWKTA